MLLLDQGKIRNLKKPSPFGFQILQLSFEMPALNEDIKIQLDIIKAEL